MKQELEQGWLKCSAVIELVGKPKEHIEKTIKEYIEKIRKDKAFKVNDARIASAEKVNTEKKEGMVDELWGNFAEIDFLADGLESVAHFCMNYMPASIEISEPEQMQWNNQEVTAFFNDLQARLHQVDMIAKQAKAENTFLTKNMHILLKNYVILLLKNKQFTLEEVSNLTGVDNGPMEKFLSNLSEVIKEGDKYKLK